MATKKKTEAAEEAKKAAQAAQNDAQSVETTEGGQEYPAEEAPRKTANTEPTEGQTDAAAETEAQDPTVEPPEPEGEALSLDSIDDLVLPGDVDPGEEQQSQRWRITDDALAPLSMDLLQSSASQIRVRTHSDAPPAGQNGRQNAPQPQGGGNGQPRQQSARNGSQSSQRGTGLSDAQLNRLYKKAEACGMTKEATDNRIREKYNHDNPADLTRAQYDEICASLDAAAAKKKEEQQDAE